MRFPIRLSAKVLSERQRGYAQVKHELWDIVSAVKANKDYLIGTEVIIETDCLLILGMVSEDEEVGVDFFGTAHVATKMGSTLVRNEFDESKDRNDDYIWKR